MSEIHDKGDKKEERRKKAAEGKAGGGAQGRETKTKSAKNKKKGGKKFDDFSDDEIETKKKTKDSKLEFMNLDELSEKFGTVTTLRDAPENLNLDLAKYFAPIFQKSFGDLLQTMYQSTLNASMVNKRRSFQDFQDKMNTMVENIRLFSKGLEVFEDDKLEKYLLKTLCSEFLNEAIIYACQENQISCENKVYILSLFWSVLGSFLVSFKV